MTLYNVVNGLEDIALTHPNIKTAKEGSIYDIMNTNPTVKYGAFVITQNRHRQTEMFDYYGLTLFYCDRLIDDMESNKLEIQSFGLQVLKNIIHVFCEDYDIDIPVITYDTWTQQFADECAGAYAQLEFEVPIDNNCSETYE